MCMFKDFLPKEKSERFFYSPKIKLEINPDLYLCAAISFVALFKRLGWLWGKKRYKKALRVRVTYMLSLPTRFPPGFG